MIENFIVRSALINPDELRGNKYQISLGLRHRFQGGHLSLAFTENLRRYNNTPDFGFQISAGLNL